MALDDWGDDTHEGELLRFLKGWMAKGERIKTAERTRRGRVQKARQGEIVGAHPPRFGFRFVRNDKGKAVGYEVDEEKMAVVRRVFRLVGEEGMTLYAVRKSLAAAGIPSPSGKKLWHQGYLRTMILDDIYRPHAFEEVRELVSEAVAATLNPSSSYGVCYYDRRHQTRTVVGEDGKAGRYRYAYGTTYRPRENWLAVPVPDSGIPRGWVQRAREAIKDNRRPSSAGLRFWELSAGVLRCAECGRAMQTTTITSSTGRAHHYYRCPLRVRWEVGVRQPAAHPRRSRRAPGLGEGLESPQEPGAAPRRPRCADRGEEAPAQGRPRARGADVAQTARPAGGQAGRLPGSAGRWAHDAR